MTNSGAGTTYNVSLNDILPAGITWMIDPAVTGCAITGNTLSCSFATLAAGAAVEINISGTALTAVCGKLDNTVTVGASNEADTTNNSATASITVNCQTPTNTPTTTATATQTSTARAIGHSCVSGSECITGFCASGVCCTTACTKPNESCNLPGSVGFCRAQTRVAPAASPRGIIALSLVLTAIGIVALRRVFR